MSTGFENSTKSPDLSSKLTLPTGRLTVISYGPDVMDGRDSRLYPKEQVHPCDLLQEGYAIEDCISSRSDGHDHFVAFHRQRKAILKRPHIPWRVT